MNVGKLIFINCMIKEFSDEIENVIIIFYFLGIIFDLIDILLDEEFFLYDMLGIINYY